MLLSFCLAVVISDRTKDLLMSSNLVVFRPVAISYIFVFCKISPGLTLIEIVLCFGFLNYCILLRSRGVLLVRVIAD